MITIEQVLQMTCLWVWMVFMAKVIAWYIKKID